MGKPQPDVPISLDGRRRITVDLTSQAATDLQYILDLINANGRQVSMSQVIRAALAFYRLEGDYKSSRYA